MENNDIASILIQKGIDKDVANQIASSLNGVNVVNLVNAIKDPVNVQAANKILGRYGVSIAPENNRLNDLMDSYDNMGGEFISEWLKPMTDSSDLLASTLIREGFNYETTVPDGSIDGLIDYLDDNDIQYMTSGNGTFQIKCEDRAALYRISKVVGNLISGQIINSGLEESLNEMSKNSREKEAKAKLDNHKARNPFALQARMRQAQAGGVIDTKAKEQQKDRHGRGAKHKSRSFDEDLDISVGQNVLVDDQPATVKISKGPNGTTGVTIGGELKMVDKSKISKIDESEDFANFAQRLRQLAGLPSLGASKISEDAPLAPLSFDDEPVAGDMPELDTAMDTAMDPSSPVVPADTSMMGSDVSGADAMSPLDPTGGMMAPEVSMDPGLDNGSQSDAMMVIERSLNDIQSNLAEVRISEYKSVIYKLTELLNQVQAAGRGYLGERRLK